MALRAATTFYWRGTTTTAFTTSTNWVITGGGAPDADDYPGWDNSEAGGTNVDGDTVIFDAAVTNACAGVDNSAKGDLAALKVTELYNKDLASSGTYLTIDMQAGAEVVIEGTRAGHIYIAGGGTQKIPILRLLDMQSGKTCYLGGTIGILDLLKGQANIIATAIIQTTLNIGYLNSAASDVTLTITAGATIPAAVDVLGGVVTCNVAVTTLRLRDGTWTQAAGNVTALHLYGGRFVWTAGNITLAYINGGNLDGSGSAIIRTITTAYLYPAGTLKIGNGVRTITVTTLHLMCETPKLYVDPGETVSI